MSNDEALAGHMTTLDCLRQKESKTQTVKRDQSDSQTPTHTYTWKEIIGLVKFASWLCVSLAKKLFRQDVGQFFCHWLKFCFYSVCVCEYMCVYACVCMCVSTCVYMHACVCVGRLIMI